MKNPFNARAPSFDADAINETIQRALASAGLDTTAGPMHDVTETIRRALAAGRLAEAAPRLRQRIRHRCRGTRRSRWRRHAARHGTASRRSVKRSSGPAASRRTNSATTPARRAYKVYVPAGKSDAPRAMIVMLHGCTQSADDFAAGTQMNRLADEHGFLVVYPEQAAHANASKCWNWFKPQDQLRGAGEPSLIAGIVREVARRHGADPRRIFVAGLSAGAAMAVVLGETYPELFAGVGAHSGLPYGSAHDIPSALAAMKGGRSGMPGLKNVPGAAGNAAQEGRAGGAGHRVPRRSRPHRAADERRTHRAAGTGRARRSGGGRRPACQYAGWRHARAAGASAARSTPTPTGQARIESWTLHGAGHAWSGGHASGSYTDGTGPDASAEMVRFFLALPRAGSA